VLPRRNDAEVHPNGLDVQNGQRFLAGDAKAEKDRSGSSVGGKADALAMRAGGKILAQRYGIRTQFNGELKGKDGAVLLRTFHDVRKRTQMQGHLRGQRLQYPGQPPVAEKAPPFRIDERPLERTGAEVSQKVDGTSPLPGTDGAEINLARRHRQYRTENFSGIRSRHLSLHGRGIAAGRQAGSTQKRQKKKNQGKPSFHSCLEHRRVVPPPQPCGSAGSSNLGHSLAQRPQERNRPFVKKA